MGAKMKLVTRMSVAVGAGALLVYGLHCLCSGSDKAERHDFTPKEDASSPREGDYDDLDSSFEAAAKRAVGIRNLDNATKLRLYALYKQAKEGDCNSSKPSILDFAASAKWNAWRDLRGVSPSTAKAQYVKLVHDLAREESGVPSASRKSERDASQSQTLGLSVSVPELSDDPKDWEIIEDIFRHSSLGDIEQVFKSLDSGVDIDSQDSEGRTPLHWAVDRNQLDLVRGLLERGAELEVKDNDGMTPLYYAVNCEYPDIVEALLEAGADINAADNDGDSPATLTTSDAIQRMISRHALERTVSINVRRPQD